MQKTIDLYTAKDIKTTRDTLSAEQKNLCAITGLPLEDNQKILEHAHDDEMFVRGVASRQANSALGVLENAWKRYLKWWYPYDLPTFLEQCAAYLRKDQDKRYRHNSFLAKLKTIFNKLNSKQQDKVLLSLGSDAGKNLKDRQAKFSKKILDKSLGGYDTIRAILNKAKEEV